MAVKAAGIDRNVEIASLSTYVYSFRLRQLRTVVARYLEKRTDGDET